jgi:TrmH family RNA methyltransferase
VSLVSTIRDLHRRRGRERRSLSLAEGVRLLEDALAAGITPRGAAVGPALEGTPRGVALKQRLEALKVPLEAVDDQELAKLADTEHPQGIVAVIEPPVWGFEQLVVHRDSTFVVLDGVQDPGNVGAVARTALGLGAAGMIALSGTADIASPKALRGSMGALFRLPSVQASPEEFLAWARAHPIEIWNTSMDGEAVRGVRRHGAVALLLGNEGAGVRAELAGKATRSVSVPLAPGVESLNVAVAAGILLYEVTRE